MKPNYLLFSYYHLLKKYRKYFSRLQNHLNKGTFSTLSSRRKNFLLMKVEKLRTRLSQLQPKLVGTVAATALLTALSMNSAMAQNPAFELKNSKNPFGPGVASTLQRGNEYSCPATGDLDGDGDLDIVISSYESFNYYENTGTNTAAKYTEKVNEDNPFSSTNGVDVDLRYPALVLFDLDGDGDLDLLAGGYNGGTGQQITYYKNTGTATSPSFVEQTGTDNPFPALPEYTLYGSPALADIDGDGDADVFMADSRYGQVYFFENTGDVNNPAFEENSVSNPFPSEDISTDGGGGYLHPTFADIDGDGDFDAIMGQNNAELLYFKNTGTITSPVFEMQTGSSNPFSEFVFNWEVPTFSDLNADGALDLILGHADDTKIYYNTGTATHPGFIVPVSFGLNARIRLADMNGDNNLDAVFTVNDENNSVRYAVNNGPASAPSFSMATGTDNPFRDAFSDQSNAFADIDGDGDLDFLASTDGGIYYENIGTSASPEFEYNPSDNPFYTFTVIGDTYAFIDLDHDGDQDLVTNGDGNFSTAVYYENTGTSTAGVYEQRTGVDNPFETIDYRTSNYFTFVNFDGDTDYDLVIGTQDYGILYYQNTGTDTSPIFEQQTGSDNPFDFINAGTNTGNKFYATAFMDADADGDLDLLVSESDGSVKFYENTSITTGLLGTHSSSTNTIVAFPNPVKDVLNYSLNDAKSSNIQVSVMDVTGSEVLHQSGAYNGSLMSLNVSALQSGIYMLRVSSDATIAVVKFVKQ